MAQSGKDNVNHHDFHYQQAESKAARGRVEDQATNIHLLRSLITESLNDAGAKNVAGRPPYDMKQSALSRCFKESMRWTTKQSSFVQRLDERERMRYSASSVSLTSIWSRSLMAAGLMAISKAATG